MLFNLDWLKESQLFPPKSEIVRLRDYEKNAKLFDDEPSSVLKPYEDRLKRIINGLSDDDTVHTSFYNSPNWWQLSTIKTIDLMLGDEPNIACEGFDDLSNILQLTDFQNKLNELVIDNDSLGECILRPYIDTYGRRNFVVQNPSMWFPIVNEEAIKEIVTDVFCWTVCVSQDANHPERNKYELHVKIQQRGNNKVVFRKYAVPKFRIDTQYLDTATGRIFSNQPFFHIGKMLEEKVEEAVYPQLVIHIPGITTSRSLHGVSGYDRITAIAAEIAIRESLANFILDQNSAPRMAAPDSAFIKNKEGKWVLKTGGRSFVVKQGEQMPIYITWDGSLQANESRIADLKKELYSMCEVGSILNNDELNSSQGYEALQVKLTNAKLKVRRMSSKFKAPLKKLIAFLCGKDEDFEKEINITFNEGIPVSEYQNILTATAKKALGFSAKSIMKEYFGMTNKQAEDEIEEKRIEDADAFIQQFGASRNTLFGGEKPKGEEPPEEEKKSPKKENDGSESDDKQ